MEIKGKVYIISDIHLKRRDPRTKIFTEFIDSSDAHLILLGDIFDIWIGRNKNFENDFKEIILTMKKQKEENNKEIVYIEGNHDFHLIWLEDLGIKRFKEAEIIINNQKFFLSHGDLYSGELSHITYRKAILQTERIFKAITNGYFEETINKIGELLSYLSHRKNSHPAFKGKRMKIAINMIKNAFTIAEEKKVDVVIFGHCHIPTVMRSFNKIYANPGLWGQNHGTFLEISEDNNLFIRTISF